MATDDQQSNPLSQMGVPPAFSLPPTPDPEPSPSTGPDPETPPEPSRPRKSLRQLVGVGGRSDFDDPRPDDEPTRTAISTASKPTSADTTRLIVGFIGLLGLGVAALVRFRMRHTLRQPTKQEKVDIATPLASILLRHADLEWLNKDLTDGLAAATAAAAYATDGPLLVPIYPDAGLPDNLQEPAA